MSLPLRRMTRPELQLPWTAVLHGAPRTKKTHNRIIRAGNFPKVLPSEQYAQWNAAIRMQLARLEGGPITKPVNCRALFLRDADRGDAANYYAALADTLQDALVIVNDSQIRSWDGSRLDVDRKNPRVIVTLEELR